MKNRTTALLLTLLLAVPMTGCGTLMFEERRDAPNSGDLDPNIMILDGLGLLLFLIPGIVAYIVDFQTGAVYLPVGVEKGEGPFFKD